MRKWNMKPKPENQVRKAITIFFFSVGRMSLDRAYNQNRF